MSFQRFLNNHIYKHLLKLYLRFNTVTTIGGLKIKVLKGVFHPKLFFSTPYLFNYLNSQNIQSKCFLEIGCGSGVIAVLAHKKGAKVTAIDIDKRAVENTRQNFALHFGPAHNAQIKQSDLFNNLSPQQFDNIIINPPYFFKKVESDWQNAWYCGAEGEYFINLFAGLRNYIHPQTEILMILADNCDIERIKSIADKNRFQFSLVEKKKVKWEMNFIFRIKYLPSAE